jgi:hypothetical protein
MDIENFFAILKDGEWHNIPELAKQIEIPADKLTEFSQFLSKQGIIEYEDQTQRIKIKPEWKELIPEEKEPATEPKITVATVMIPPETTVDIQSTLIQNATKIDLELTLRINGKIQEVVINL